MNSLLLGAVELGADRVGRRAAPRRGCCAVRARRAAARGSRSAVSRSHREPSTSGTVSSRYAPPATHSPNVGTCYWNTGAYFWSERRAFL